VVERYGGYDYISQDHTLGSTTLEVGMFSDTGTCINSEHEMGHF
jgi:hypothetical protein